MDITGWTDQLILTYLKTFLSTLNLNIRQDSESSGRSRRIQTLRWEGGGGVRRSSRPWDNKGLKIRGAGPPGFSPRFATETLLFNPGDHKGLVSFFIWCVILLNFTAPSTIPFKDQCLFWHNYFRTLHQVNYYGLLGWEREREGEWGDWAWV